MTFQRLRARIGGHFEIGVAFNLSFEGERRTPANVVAAEHGVMLRLPLRDPLMFFVKLII